MQKRQKSIHKKSSRERQRGRDRLFNNKFELTDQVFKARKRPFNYMLSDELELGLGDEFGWSYTEGVAPTPPGGFGLFSDILALPHHPHPHPTLPLTYSLTIIHSSTLSMIIHIYCHGG